jgi:hypothetical protein
MSTARMFLSTAVLGSMLVFGCTTTKAVVEPEVEIVSPPPEVFADQATVLAMGPPPGYVKPEIYWVREKIILGVASAPETPATSTSPAKKGKKAKKTAKKVT